MDLYLLSIALYTHENVYTSITRAGGNRAAIDAIHSFRYEIAAGFTGLVWSMIKEHGCYEMTSDFKIGRRISIGELLNTE